MTKQKLYKLYRDENGAQDWVPYSKGEKQALNSSESNTFNTEHKFIYKK